MHTIDSQYVCLESTAIEPKGTPDVKDVGFPVELRGAPKVRLGVPAIALHNGTPTSKLSPK